MKRDNVLDFHREIKRRNLHKAYILGYKNAKKKGDPLFIYDAEFMKITSTDDDEFNRNMYAEWKRGYNDFIDGVYQPMKDEKESEGMMKNYINELGELTKEQLTHDKAIYENAYNDYNVVKTVLPEEREQCIGCPELRHMYDLNFTASNKKIEYSDNQSNCTLIGCGETISCIDMFAKDDYLSLIEYAKMREQGGPDDINKES